MQPSTNSLPLYQPMGYRLFWLSSCQPEYTTLFTLKFSTNTPKIRVPSPNGQLISGKRDNLIKLIHSKVRMTHRLQGVDFQTEEFTNANTPPLMVICDRDLHLSLATHPTPNPTPEGPTQTCHSHAHTCPRLLPAYIQTLWKENSYKSIECSLKNESNIIKAGGLVGLLATQLREPESTPLWQQIHLQQLPVKCCTCWCGPTPAGKHLWEPALVSHCIQKHCRCHLTLKKQTRSQC